jgi:hypothetical protein
MHCQACGALTAYRRRYCNSCGEPLARRDLIRQLFAADPGSADESPPSGPALELASPRARIVAAGIDITIMVVALFFVGVLGEDPAFGSGGPPLRLVLLAWAAVLIHPVLLEGPGGQTVGKRLVGIRVVCRRRAARSATGWPPTGRRLAPCSGSCPSLRSATR